MGTGARKGCKGVSLNPRLAPCRVFSVWSCLPPSSRLPPAGMVAVLEVLRDTTKEGSPVSEVEWMMGWAAVQPTGTLKIEARGAQPGPGDPYNGGEVIFYYRPDSMVAVRTALDVSTEEWPTPNGRCARGARETLGPARLAVPARLPTCLESHPPLCLTHCCPRGPAAPPPTPPAARPSWSRSGRAPPRPTRR